MRKRWLAVALFALLGLAVLACAWVLPIYLWALDPVVLQKAGKGTPTLVERGLHLVDEHKLGAAELLLESARQEGIAGRAELGLAVTNWAARHPDWKVWGGGGRHLEVLFASAAKQRSESLATPGSDGEEPSKRSNSVSEPLTEWMIRTDNRTKVLDILRASAQSG